MTEALDPRSVRLWRGAFDFLNIAIPVSRLEQLKRLLEANGISYYVDEVTITMDDEPEFTTLELGRSADPEVVRRLLDEIR
jgi:hypothetical protein